MESMRFRNVCVNELFVDFAAAAAAVVIFANILIVIVGGIVVVVASAYAAVRARIKPHERRHT